jgi:hypothetical protein
MAYKTVFKRHELKYILTKEQKEATQRFQEQKKISKVKSKFFAELSLLSLTMNLSLQKSLLQKTIMMLL